MLIGNILKQNGLLHEIIEGRKREVNQQEGGEGFRCYVTCQMMRAVALTWTAEVDEEWQHKERMSETCCSSGTLIKSNQMTDL